MKLCTTARLTLDLVQTHCLDSFTLSFILAESALEILSSLANRLTLFSCLLFTLLILVLLPCMRSLALMYNVKRYIFCMHTIISLVVFAYCSVFHCDCLFCSLSANGTIG